MDVEQPVKPKGRDEITDAQENYIWGQHKYCPEVDSVLAWLLMGVYLFQSFYKIFKDFQTASFGAYGFTISIFNYVGLIVHLLIFLLWLTFCFNLRSMHALWSVKTWMSPALMPGGFAPRFGAFVLGLVLFVNSAVISESLVPGYLIQWGYVWRPTPLCRATFVTLHDKKNAFSKRFTRVAATGCFSPGKHEEGLWWLESLRTPEVRAIGHPFGRDAWNKTIPHNLIKPDPKAIANTWYGKLHLNDIYCNYQCVSWAEVAFNDLVAELGLIFAGAAVVVGLVDSVTAAVGWSMVTEDSSIKTLKHLRDISSRYGWAPCGLTGLAKMCCSIFHKSRLFCALQLIGVDWCARWCAKTLDVDGYYTVDYYVTMVLFQSLFLATMLRLWNPFTVAPVVYTKLMWTQGNDTFLDLTVDPPVLKTIDLFEWLHLTTMQRMHYVSIYARRVGFDSIVDKKDDGKESNSKQDKERNWRETPDCCYKIVHALHRAWVCCLYCGRHEVKDKGEAEETMSVQCLKTFEGVRTIERTRNGQEFEDKERIKIKRGTEGTVTGKTVNKLIVKWNLKGYANIVETKADPLYASQWSPEWKEYMEMFDDDESDDDDDDYERQVSQH